LSAHLPFVRVIVVSFNGVELTLECLRSLALTQWPANRFEVVLVDNASKDDVVERCAQEFPLVRIIESSVNTGFAGGCNLGITSKVDHCGDPLVEFDLVALINNDAIVDRAWLDEMNRVMETNDQVGAVAAKVLLGPKFSRLVIIPQANENNQPLFIGVHGLRINGTPQNGRFRFDESFLREGSSVDSLDNSKFWTRRGGSIWIVEPEEDQEYLGTIEIAVELIGNGSALIQSGQESVLIKSSDGDGQNSPIQQIVIKVERQTIDLMNSAGCELYKRGFGGDRGYQELDHEKFDISTEVFAWSGAGVLLRRSYLEDVGLFDCRLFLYYEDFDLSWRGRLAGWKYLYAPRAVIRHRHAQTSVEGSEVFHFYTTRNRLLVLAKNAPLKMAGRAGLGEISRLFKCVYRDVVLQILKGKKPLIQVLRRRGGIVKSYLGLLPSMLYQRWTMERRIHRRALMVWEKDKAMSPGFEIDEIIARQGLK